MEGQGCSGVQATHGMASPHQTPCGYGSKKGQQQHKVSQHWLLPFNLECLV